MKFRLCDWEDNGYHDSYFHGVYFDTEDGKLHSLEYGATAYAGGVDFTGSSAGYLPPTPEIVERARLELAKLIFAAIKSAELADVLTPQDAPQGTFLRLLEPHKSKKLGTTLETGTVIRVNLCDAFGTFYRNGYNKPGRSNRSVIGTIKGRPDLLVRVPLAKCRLDREPDTDAQLLQRADELSHNHQYGSAFGCKAWLSNNWALQVAEKQAKLQQAA